MLKHIALALCLAVAVSACGKLKLGGPPGQDPILGIAGTLGVGCGAIPAAGKPQDVLTARAAVGCATLLIGPEQQTVDLAAIQACVRAVHAPAKYEGFLNALTVRLQQQYGGSGIFASDSKGAEAIRAFLAVCGAALG